MTPNGWGLLFSLGSKESCQRLLLVLIHKSNSTEDADVQLEHTWPLDYVLMYWTAKLVTNVANQTSDTELGGLFQSINIFI